MRISFAAIAFLALAAELPAQTVTGAILGTVSDTSGARVASATITAVNSLTQEKHTSLVIYRDRTVGARPDLADANEMAVYWLNDGVGEANRRLERYVSDTAVYGDDVHERVEETTRSMPSPPKARPNKPATPPRPID